MSSDGILVSIGFNNCVNISRVLAVFNPQSTAGKKLVAAARDDGTLLDVTMGRKTRAVILFDNKLVAASAINPQTLRERGCFKNDEEAGENA